MIHKLICALVPGLSPGTRRANAQGRFVLVIRIVVEELESWFIGDPQALREAFPKLPPATSKGIFARPDNQGGRAWENLHRYLNWALHAAACYPRVRGRWSLGTRMQGRSGHAGAGFRLDPT